AVSSLARFLGQRKFTVSNDTSCVEVFRTSFNSDSNADRNLLYALRFRANRSSVKFTLRADIKKLVQFRIRPLLGFQGIPLSRVPDLDRLVQAGRGEARSVPAPCYILHFSLMPAQCQSFQP